MAARNGAFARESLDIHGASKERVGAACQEFISRLLREIYAPSLPGLLTA